jgi:hypothetical protein
MPVTGDSSQLKIRGPETPVVMDNSGGIDMDVSKRLSFRTKL